MRKAIICILMIVVLCSLAACQTLQPVIPDVSEQQKVTGELQLLRSDLKLTQEQVIRSSMTLANSEYSMRPTGRQGCSGMFLRVRAD